MKTTHTHFTVGKRVRIVFKDGSVHVGRFGERQGRFITVDGVRVRTDLLRNVSIYKQPATTNSVQK